MKAALAAGKPMLVDSAPTIADGIAVRIAGDKTFELVRRYADEIVTVDDEETAKAILRLLERQKTTVAQLEARKAQVARHLDSCVLAMHNLRLDLLKLKSSNVAEVMGDITQATQAARALSRNVDNAIAAAGEVKEAMER